MAGANKKMKVLSWTCRISPPILLLLITAIFLRRVTPYKIDMKRRVPEGLNEKFFRSTPIGPFFDIEVDPPRVFLTSTDHTRIISVNYTQAETLYKEEIEKLDGAPGATTPVDSAKTKSYIQIAKNPKGKKTRSVPFLQMYSQLKEEHWFFDYKGSPISTIAICTLVLPILIAGLLQMCINSCCLSKNRLSRRTYEFPIVPVLLLQQTRREYFLRKKTVRRFCIQWEVGRINIRMNTRLVDLRQILHPPKKRKKIHKYTTWRIIRLIVRFNAFLALRKKHASRTQVHFHLMKQKREKTWQTRVNTSQYLLEKKLYDDFQESESHLEITKEAESQQSQMSILKK